MKTNTRFYSLVLCTLIALLAVPGISGATIEAAPLNPAFLEYLEGQEAAAEGAMQTCSIAPSPEEFRYPLTGLCPAPATPVWSVQSIDSVGSSALPASFDLRDEGRVTPVQDQGKSGSCWAFATYASLESALLTSTGTAWDFSESNMKNLCSNLYGGFDRGPGDGGQAFMSTAYLTRWSGPVNETDDPYLLPVPSNDSPTDLSPGVHVQNITFLPPRDGPLDNGPMKETIREEGALWVGFIINWSCFADNYLTYYRPGDGAYQSDGGHAVALVGWDDNYPAENFSVTPPGDGAFIAKNSWGEGVGDGGYFYISYYQPEPGRFWDRNSTFVGDRRDFCSVLFTGEAADSLEHIYQYDPLGWTENVGATGSTTIYGANVFTAGDYEDLRAAGFYTREPGTDYTVSVLRSINTPTGTTPVTVAQVSGTATLPGYHTVPLPDPVFLSPGQTFSVVLEITALTDTYPLVVEMPIAGYSSNATASPGESYVSVDGEIWTDLTTIFPDTNACIKAFTTDAIVVPRDYPTIQAAINAADGGETIVVENGTYDEHLNITSSVTIVGIGMPVVNAAGSGSAITVTADGVHLSGIAVTGASQVFQPDAYNAGILVLGDGALIENCSSYQNGACGVFVSGAGGAVIQGNEISENLYGMILWNSSRTVVAGNRVHNNSRLGIELDETDSAILEGNTVQESDGQGISLYYTANTTMQGNIMGENAWNFVYYGDDPAPKNSIDTSNIVEGRPIVYLEGISGMTINPSSNAGAVCCVGCDSMKIEGLALQETGCGISLLSTQESSIEGCTISGAYDGIHLSNASGIAIEGCSITASRTDEWLINIERAENCSLVGTTLTGLGGSSMGLYNVSGAEITGNTINFTSSGGPLRTGEISSLTNSTVRENLLDLSGMDFSVDGLRGNLIYRNTIVLPAPGPASLSSALPLPEREHSYALTRPFSGLSDGVVQVSSVSCASAAAFQTGNTWHSPDPIAYWYRGTGQTNFTGNHWSAYGGIDADGDGIGDTPFVIAANETDRYPLMERFEAYPATPPSDGGDSSSDGGLAASGNLNPGETTSLHFTGSAVTGVSVTAGQRIDGIMVTIAPASSGPAGLEAPVYQYLVANLTYTTDDAIAGAAFTFEVSTAWLEEQGLSPGDISLWRYRDGAWAALPTEVLREENGRVYFRATSPGFSYFAVAGGRTMTVEPVGTVASEEPGDAGTFRNVTAPGSAISGTPVSTTAEPGTPTETTPQKSPVWWGAALAAVGVMALGLKGRR
ncbi:lectin like domain-containing protein [Methanofollis tationis]|uniref:Right-handed parallel beta-helix repeat-containing protein n=1 Tax=Methanofollis tationis TaxID=81417 RepID=A0A7K4HQ81_9EURY|nr:lectin like domain-containing protein [Methanofollis tationis]NVO67423.1 right-handed parallel beta-helix repeat-containing protein [Methanofollis tationis]